MSLIRGKLLSHLRLNGLLYEVFRNPLLKNELYWIHASLPLSIPYQIKFIGTLFSRRQNFCVLSKFLNSNCSRIAMPMAVSLFL